MPFNSYRFIVFLACVLAVYNAAPTRLRPYLLLVASYVFYANAYPPYLALLLLVTVTAYIGARVVYTHRRRLWLVVFIVLVLLPLVAAKYLGFFATVWRETGVTRRLGLFDAALPIGISFYTLQAIAYIVDVSRDAVTAETRLVPVALYLAFFPQLLAGPIERGGKLLPQLYCLRKSTARSLYIGMKYLAWGFFCKLVVADNVALIVDRVLASPTQESGGSLTATFAMYSFQLYFDFLGYTTIAIGVARLFEVQLSQNFDRPYGSTSLRDFWRRWHITLSSWFRDYIYVPLGGKATRGLSRVGQMLVVFFVSGLWHGAGLNFLAWGGFHGTAYVLEEHLRKRRDNGNSQSAGRDRLSSWGRLAITFSIVTVAWVFFRLSDFSEIHAVFERIFFINTDVPYWSINPVLMQADSLIFLGILLTGIALDSSRQARVMVEWVPTKRREIATELVFVNWLVVTLVLVGNQGSRDFVYFRF